MHTLLAVSALTAALIGQVPFDQAVKDIDSPDSATRLRAAQMFKSAGYPEAAVPLAKLVLDPKDEIQLEAIAAELNIFLAEKVIPRSRVAFVIEKRNAVAAAAAFEAGPQVIGPRPVPLEVLSALRAAFRDETPRVALEAVYAFGALAAGANGAARRELLRASGVELVAVLGAPDPAVRYAGLSVIARVFARAPGDAAVDPAVGDAIVTAMNDADRTLAVAAIHAAGVMRYERALQGLTDLFQYYGKGQTAEAALDALGHIAHPASAALFEAQLASKVVVFRGIAVEGLARLGDPARIPRIQAALGGERDAGVLLAQAFAAAALAKAPIAPMTDAIKKSRLREQARLYLVELAPGRSAAFAGALKDGDPQVRLVAVDALGLSADRAALPLVQPLATDADPQVARAAERAVARLGRSSSPVAR